MERRHYTRPETKKPQGWAIQAAQNAIDITPYLIEPGEEIPEIRVDDMVARIETAFQDRAGWNQAVHESQLEPEEKMWLIVP